MAWRGRGGAGVRDSFDYSALVVKDPEVKDLFNEIEKYHPQTLELETKFKPFIPEFIPGVGDVDGFLKPGRPDEKTESLGLLQLDEPKLRSTDPAGM